MIRPSSVTIRTTYMTAATTSSTSASQSMPCWLDATAMMPVAITIAKMVHAPRIARRRTADA